MYMEMLMCFYSLPLGVYLIIAISFSVVISAFFSLVVNQESILFTSEISLFISQETPTDTKPSTMEPENSFANDDEEVSISLDQFRQTWM